MRRILASLILAAVAAPVPLAAQEPSSKVMLPWQQARAKPKPPAPQKPDALPWQSRTVEALPWRDKSDAAWSKASAKVSAVETGAIDARADNDDGDGAQSKDGKAVGNGLVLKPNVAAPVTPPPTAKAVAASPEAAPDRNPAATGSDPGRDRPLLAQAAAPVKPAAATASPKSEVVAAGAATAATAETAASAKVEAATPQAPATTTAEAAAAADTPTVEEAPSIPAALPEATVTPAEAPAAMPVLRTPAGANDKPKLPKRLSDGANVAQQYCFNIADAAKDARYAWQKKTLADVEQDLNKRIALLDQRTAEYQKWLARRDDFIRQAEDGVVKIYAGMKPDAAAGRLALMNEEMAAALLTKLGPRSASAILNEMEAAKAAKLTMIITGAARLKRKQQAADDPATTVGGAATAGPAQAPADATANGPRS